ncbi:MAG TPA: LamG-like jellyroll fold domain-containing protein [Planctomycetota bacterium]
MGQAIVYCCGCQSQLRGADFEKGGAVQFKGQAYCKKCARERIPPDVLATLTAPAEKPPERLPPPPSTPRPFVPREKPKSSAGLLAAAIVGAAALAVVVLLVSGGNPPPAPPPPAEVATPVRAPEPPRPAPPKPAPPRVDREAVAWDALRDARAFAAAHPNDPAGRRARFEKALREAQGTSLEAAVRNEIKELEEDRREEMAALDARVREAADVEDFPKAFALLEEARKTRPKAVEPRIPALRELADRRYAPLREKAVDAQRRGAAAEVQALRERIAKWGVPELAADLEKAVADAGRPPGEEEARRAAWAAAIEPAAGRDYAAAIRNLETLPPRAETAADVRDLRELQAAVEETLQRLLKTPRGQKLALVVYDEAGKPRRVDGAVTRADARGLEIDALPVLPGELLPESLAELIAAKHPKRLASLLRALEGDPEKDAGIPERFALRRPDPKREAEARQAFWEAERELADFAAAAGAVAKLAAFQKDFEATAFARRNRASIQARGEGGREFFFFADLLKAGGTFRSAKHAKAGACWTSDADGGTLKENFVELEFSMLPAVEYRGWAYVGGCCGETLAASYQVGEAEPVPVPSPLYAINRRHANHGGPKEPSRWGWIPLPLPKVSAAGPVKLRLLTDQKGFSVALAFVSATHAKPPTEAEVREREKSKLPAAPAMSPIRDVDDAELAGRWNFDQGGADASKHGRHGILSGNPVAAAGRAGKALAFDGVDDAVRIPDAEGLTIKTLEMTVSAWVFRTGEGGSGQPVLNRQRGGWKNDQLNLSLPGGVPTLSVFTTAGLRTATVSAALPLQRWTHLAGTYDGTALRLYVNGTEAASDAGPAGSHLIMETKPLTVGAAINDDSDRPNEFFLGSIDEVRLYYRTLTPAEIAALAGK